MGDIADRIEALKLSALDCHGCGLSETRTHVVFGEGNPETPLVIIGEGPGQNEDATGRPFVGRAGALLDQALAENNMSRKHVYIMNTIKCRACIIENGRTRNRPPATPEMSACFAWLEKQLAIIQPLVILCLGAPSANTIIHGNFRMTQERGQFFESKYARYAIAALHPAYVLRQVGEAFDQARRQFVEDIDAARRKVIEVKKEIKLGLF
jgi:uracil-DNA glycosylase